MNITGAPVSGTNLFGRDYELQTLWERLEAGQHVLMLAPRRIGKTSLMHELRRRPREGWIVFYSDQEWGTEAGDCIADIIAHLASHPTTRTLLEATKNAIPLGTAIADRPGRVTGSVAIDGLRIELKGALAADWMASAGRLHGRLAGLPAQHRILFILDEFPILLSTMLRRPEGPPLGGRRFGSATRH